MQYVSHSSYLVSIGAIARLIYIYETTVLKLSQSTKFSGGHAPRPPKRCREQLIKRNPKCCPPPPLFTTFLHPWYYFLIH